MNPTTATVSVIVPTANRSTLLRRAVRSVLGQTLGDLECIVVDDGSSDETEKTLAELAQDDSRVRFFAHPVQRGASAARNTGIRQARGRLLAFLDDDDVWLPEKLEKQVALLDALPARFGLVYCWMDYFGENGEIVARHRPELRGYVFPQVIDRQRLGGCPTLLIRRPVLDAVGGFDEELRRGNDGDFIRRVCRQYEVDVVPEVLVHVDAGHGQERISGIDRESLETGIRGHQVKLEKFGPELEGLPHALAEIHAQIGAFQLELGRPREALRSFTRAVRACPKHLTTYRHLARGLAYRVTR